MDSAKPNGKANCKVARSPLVYKPHVYHPYIKNLSIGGGFMVLGEICAQSIKMWYESPPSHPEEKNLSGKISITVTQEARKPWRDIVANYELNKIARQGAIGSFQGFYQYIYYSWLDKVFVGASFKVVAKKVFLDEVFLGPISLLIFFFYNGFCDTYTMSGALERCRQSFIPSYVADLAFWPILQTINFALVPPAYRVLYVAFFTSIWDTYLCFLNTRVGEEKHKSEDQLKS
ncbi:unnamed protein product [Heterobilharzia americana]|nr:unnamed protein product [Heterobilharzia americana]